MLSTHEWLAVGQFDYNTFLEDGIVKTIETCMKKWQIMIVLDHAWENASDKRALPWIRLL